MNFASDAGRATAFEYCQLAASIQNECRTAANAIRRLLQRGSQDVIQIGLQLQMVQNALGRERFPAWLSSEFSWSRSVASKYMCVARVFAQREHLHCLQPSALYVLARRNVNPLAREEALRLAAEGQFISKATAQILVRRYATTPQTRNALPKSRRRIVERLKRLPVDEIESIANELLTFLGRPALPAVPPAVDGAG